MERTPFVITTRELKEIDHAMYYAQNLAHGTTGHNQLMLLAKVAAYLGFARIHDGQGEELFVPDGVKVEDPPSTGRQGAG